MQDRQGRVGVGRREAVRRAVCTALAGAAAGAMAAFGTHPAVGAALPELGPAQQLEPGVILHEAVLPGASGPSKVWIYLPEKRGGRVPCVLIAPPGSRMYHGMSLGEGERAVHLQYVRAGMAVVAYELDGPTLVRPTPAQFLASVRAFKAANAGVSNARAALDFALARVPELDSRRIYTLGQNSAGTVALLAAARDPRVSACVAFAPMCNPRARLGGSFLKQVSAAFPDYSAFITRSSPLENAARIRCPVFLFHADDDSVVTRGEVDTFAHRLSLTNHSVRFVEVPTGNHYDSMLRQGIPQSIAWLKGLPAGKKK